MRQNDIDQALRDLLRRVGKRQQPFVLAAIVVLIVVFTWLAPALERRFGWRLPDFESGGPSGTSASKVEPGSSARSARSPKPPRQARVEKLPDQADAGEQEILQAFRGKRSNLQVTGRATVRKLLPDDDVGDRHQKMILELTSGHTLLLAHNIDLAHRIPVDEGDTIEFSGEYEYSEQGGVLHWTHHDPRGLHPDGWIKLRGKKYQ